MYINPMATDRRRRMFEWYLSQCYADYDPFYFDVFAYRWNRAVEKRLLREWNVARGIA